MGRKPSPNGRSASRYNRLTHGVMLHSILPSRGLEHCPLSGGCPCWDDDLRHLCVPGEPCAWESWFQDRYVTSGRESFQRCLQWLSQPERDRILQELSLLSLRRRRLSALIAREGLYREKRHPVSGLVYGLKATVGVCRYATAIDRLFNPLFEQLVLSPEERMQTEEDDRDEPLVLPYPRPDTPDPPADEAAPLETEIENPAAGWSSFARRWDHAPGMPKTDDDNGIADPSKTTLRIG